MYVDTAKVNTSLEELNSYSERIHQEILQLENKQTDSKKIAVDLQQLKEDLETTKIENLPDGQTRGIEVDLMSNLQNRQAPSRPTYESITREDIENSFL